MSLFREEVINFKGAASLDFDFLTFYVEIRFCYYC